MQPLNGDLISTLFQSLENNIYEKTTLQQSWSSWSYIKSYDWIIVSFFIHYILITRQQSQLNKNSPPRSLGTPRLTSQERDWKSGTFLKHPSNIMRPSVEPLLGNLWTRPPNSSFYIKWWNRCHWKFTIKRTLTFTQKPLSLSLPPPSLSLFPPPNPQ